MRAKRSYRDHVSFWILRKLAYTLLDVSAHVSNLVFEFRIALDLGEYGLPHLF